MPLKKLLGVDGYTPCDLVYGELQQYLVIVNSVTKSISYWLKFTRMNNDRLPYKANKIHDLDRRAKQFGCLIFK